MSLDALLRLARAYPGGIDAIAVRLGKYPGSLRAELCPPLGSSAKLGWNTAIEIMAMAHQVRMPDALTPLDMVEGEFGRVCFVESSPPSETGGNLMRDVAAGADAFSRLVRELAAGAADEVITDNELEQIRAAAGALVSGVHVLLARVGEINARGKPAHLQRVA